VSPMTIRDIARISEVTVATVSRVINGSPLVKEETQAKVEAVIRENDFVPNPMARGLSTGVAESVTVILPDISNPFFAEVVKGISAEAEKFGLTTVLYDTDENPRREATALRNITRHHTRGIIITPVSDSAASGSTALELMTKRGIPVVLVDRDTPNSTFDGVFIDNVTGAREAVDALIESGHRKIAVVAGPTDSKPGRERLAGYQQALEEHGIRMDDRLVLQGDFRLDSGYTETLRLLSENLGVTAIFSCNNLMTLGVIKALREQGIAVPGGMGLVGFDEIPALDILGMPITHVARPTVEMGRIALSLLVDQMERGTGDNRLVQRVTLPPALVRQGSENMNKE